MGQDVFENKKIAVKKALLVRAADPNYQTLAGISLNVFNK